ncbi:MAG: glucokinase [Paracoccaceae bacterium]|nr:glucokinase [Paracoccaceae bacterium]
MNRAVSLVADVGGTNTRVALADGTEILEGTVRKYPNADYPGLETILRHYANEQRAEVHSACAAIAGPVHEGVGEMTNLDWTFDLNALARATGAQHTAILNDLQAQGYALGDIKPENLKTVITSPEQPRGNTKLVIGVGTGFNAAVVYETQTGRLVPPSECGHANLPIRTEAELRLCHYVETAHGFPSVEDVLSGRGLERVYRWLGHEAGDEAELSAADIMARIRDGADPRATETARVFAKILGTVAGNLSLIHLPFGGVYLIGGVARAFAPFLEGFGFGAAFRDKGRFAGFMTNFGVTIIEDDFAALIGCASHLQEIRQDRLATRSA